MPYVRPKIHHDVVPQIQNKLVQRLKYETKNIYGRTVWFVGSPNLLVYCEAQRLLHTHRLFYLEHP